MDSLPNDQGTPRNLPEISDFNGLTQFFKGTTPEDYLHERERDLYSEFGYNPREVEPRLAMLEHAVEKRRVQWACISAKSQREKKNEHRNGVSFIFQVFDNLTTIRYNYDRDTTHPPPDNFAKPIQQFTKRSRQRLMNRARRMNKQGLPLPFFVTLTYHENFKEPKTAKRHLNAFFQRWRRRSEDFAYMWKMEPQERGAVHFHLAMFIPETLQNKILNECAGRCFYPGNKEKGKPAGYVSDVLGALKYRIQNDWAEVTKEIDGVPVPFTRIDYIRKRKFKDEAFQVKGNKRKVRTRCANPRVEYKMEPDFEHLYFGTNVRPVDNWKMFLGYVYKYMEKEVRKNPFNVRTLIGEIREGSPGFIRPPFRNEWVKVETPKIETGRFWGFSYNLDFSALQTTMIGYEKLEQVNAFCNALNAVSFATLTEHLKANAKRKKQELKNNPRKLKRKLDHYRAIYERQKRRYLMQKDKIKRGAGLQFEIKHAITLHAESYIDSFSVKEWFSDGSRTPGEP